MPVPPPVLLSAFADEAAVRKTILEQLTALAAIGLRYYSPRFLDLDGTGKVGHVVDLSPADLQRLAELNREFGLQVATVGSRLGKVKLKDVDDGTKNRYVPFDEYLRTEVAGTARVARALGTRLVRGFSFYHPRQEQPEAHVPQAVDQLGRIADLFAKEGLVYGLEVEANLIGQNGPLLAQLAEGVNRPNLVLIFDGANLAHQGYSPQECFDHYAAMRPHLGWLHVKDYQARARKHVGGPVDEDADWNFVPANQGDANHERILRDLRGHLPTLDAKLRGLGAPGVILDLEPHVKGGGQFGGYSGPDGMGVAARALCSLLDYVGIGYDLRTFDDIRAARGF